MLNVALIRHSMTEGNLKKRYIGITDEDLCEEGIARIHQITYPDVEIVYASPLKRCIQTAQIIYPDKKRVLMDSLKECNFGDFENKNYLELSDNADYQKWIDNNGKTEFPNGEHPDFFKQRCIAGFKEIVDYCNANKQHQTIAIIAHGGTIMSILEELAYPKKDYYSWNVDNAKGYYIQVNDTDYEIKVSYSIK